MYNKDAMTGRKDEFYELRNKVAPKLDTLVMLTNKDPSKATAYYEANKASILMAQATQTTLQELAAVREAKSWLNSPAAAEKMSKAQREEKLKALTEAERGLVAWVREAKPVLMR